MRSDVATPTTATGSGQTSIADIAQKSAAADSATVGTTQLSSASRTSARPIGGDCLARAAPGAGRLADEVLRFFAAMELSEASGWFRGCQRTGGGATPADFPQWSAGSAGSFG